MAMAYDTIWGAYPQMAARAIMEYQKTTSPQANGRVLDLCCGAGQLAEIFLKSGFEVVGVDLSTAMLERASVRCAPFVRSGKARFFEADVSDFRVEGEFSLIVSTYDALNHLGTIEQLENCFRCAREVMREDGMFIFDFSTLKGLEEWNRITVTDKDHAAVVTRGFFDRGESKGYKKFTGFLKRTDGLYHRFEELIFAVGHRLDAVRQALEEAGFGRVHVAKLDALGQAVPEPESEDRVLFVSQA